MEKTPNISDFVHKDDEKMRNHWTQYTLKWTQKMETPLDLDDKDMRNHII